MTTLTHRKVWRRSETVGAERRHDLTDEQVTNVRRALRTLHLRLGSWAAVAEATAMSRHTLSHGGVGAKLAMRTARAAGVSVDEVLRGEWPKAGCCPMCGRSDP